MNASMRGDKPPCVLKESRLDLRAQSAGHNPSGERSECERSCWDPKDGGLCLHRVDPGDSLLVAGSDCDVQIVRQIWA